MATRTTWLDAGLEMLARDGAPGVTIERLTAQLGLSKGSYYHHFKGAAGFRTALLEQFEAQFTTRLIDTVAPLRWFDRLGRVSASDEPS